MQARVGWLVLAVAAVAFGDVADDEGHHHHHHHHHKHHKQVKQTNATDAAVATKPPVVVKAAVQQKESSIVGKMKALEAKLAKKAKAQADAVTKGHLLVNGPVPQDFSERFAQAVYHATGADASKVKVTEATPLEDNPAVVEVSFLAPPKTVKEVETEAADPESKLAKGNMRPFLVAKSDEDVSGTASFVVHKPAEKAAPAAAQEAEEPVTPVEEKGIDIDTSMPYGDLEPFGREDTAQELTESSVKESDAMVDQLERAEVAEEKRSVFRALTRLRGAAITSFDGVARSQTGNIDEYNKVHKWRKAHPLHHLADEESDVSKWAFPDNADF